MKHHVTNLFNRSGPAAFFRRRTLCRSTLCGGRTSPRRLFKPKYFGYFANQYGEQSVFVCDHATCEASVWMGDTGWGKAHRVVDGRPEGIILTESEAVWIRACWLAAAEGLRREWE